MNTPKITKLRHSAPFGAVRSRLEGRVFHVSRLSNLDPILTSGEIRPNQDATFATTFGSSSNSFFRNRGCVSLFDYRSVTPDELEDSVFKCSPMQPATPQSGIAIFMLAVSTCPPLLSWKLWKEQGAMAEMVVPYVEAGHQGPISLSLVDEIICIEVVEDPNSFAYRLARAVQNAARMAKGT